MTRAHDWREVVPEHTYTRITGEIVKYAGERYQECANCGKRLDKWTPPLGRCRGRKVVV
jgi:hypothetical protein